jgi:hypothetical protein
MESASQLSFYLLVACQMFRIRAFGMKTSNLFWGMPLQGFMAVRVFFGGFVVLFPWFCG